MNHVTGKDINLSHTNYKASRYITVNWTIHWQTNWRSVKSQTGQLAN